MLPVDMIFVRHGESEGNIAIKASVAGDNSLFTPAFRDRHSRDFRLTDVGIAQARSAGEWLRANVRLPFDRYYVSDYIRAKETAAELELDDAGWSVEFQLRERDKALMDNLPQDEQATLFAREQTQYKLDPFLSIPAGGGESIPALCLRAKADTIADLARECSDKSVLLVCHGQTMRAVQLELLNLGHDDFLRLEASGDPADKIRNCQIMWYTRRDPETKRIAGSKLYAWRSITPRGENTIDSGWKRVERRRFTNEDLRRDVDRYPRHAS